MRKTVEFDVEFIAFSNSFIVTSYNQKMYSVSLVEERAFLQNGLAVLVP